VRFAAYVPTFGDYDVPTLVALARETEAAGGDGFFVWDHLVWAPDQAPLADTTVALTAIALSTQRLRFGALVTPLARRRPWKYAKESATLDRLSGGRLVAGIESDFHPVGEHLDAIERARRLDESLEIVSALWSGEEVTHHGERFQLERVAMHPTPIQQPSIPIWVAGFWPNRPPFRRAARWNGAIPQRRTDPFKPLSPEEFRECAAYVSTHRTSDGPFELVASWIGPGRSAPASTTDLALRLASLVRPDWLDR
jgi:alkanesulfonate monooxygenase SsuD/methylene tetrahydromethanopterin reductase-like flavin-dependent oxidoreductase (luciferase family)